MTIFAKSSHGRILQAMQSDTDRKWMIKDFVKGKHFVGYEAGTRMCDLVRTGYVESEKIEGSRFCNYMLTDKGLQYIPDTVAEDCSDIFEQITIEKKQGWMNTIKNLINSL